jgi:flagellar hook-associated protein 2
MALITSAGVGSGLDLEGIIQATVNAENLPKIAKFEKQETELSVQLSSIGAIKSSLSSLSDVVDKLNDIDNFNKRTATITQPDSGDLVSVTTTSNSTIGEFNVEVVQLAQGSRAVTADGLFSASSDVVTASGGTLTIAAGSKTPFQITLAAGATLDDVRNAINSATDNFGVTANIINTGGASPQAKLVLTSAVTGSGNDLVITSDTDELNSVSTTPFSSGTAGLSIAASDSATDAIIKVDGISITNDTNTFTDAVQDITITALAQSTNQETAKISVETDKSSVEKTIEEFITAFNNTIGTINYHMAENGALNGDSAIRSLKNQLINQLSSTVSGAGNFETLYDIGLGLSKDGVLEKESLVRSLSDALTSGYDDVGTLFAGKDGDGTGLAGMFSSLIENYVTSSGSGVLKQREDSLDLELKQVSNDRANHEYRMSQLEERLRQKYASLDVLISQMKSTGDYLSGQLSSLPGFTKQNS